MHVWIAELGTVVAGSVAARLDHENSMGEIYMIAVDPAHQDKRIGSLLTSFALQWFK